MARGRKSQTRLNFGPSSSSPSRGDVAIGSSKGGSKLRTPGEFMPTPQPSSQMKVDSGDDILEQLEQVKHRSEAAMSRPLRSGNKPRQTTLTPRRSRRLHSVDSSPASPRSSSQRLDPIQVSSPSIVQSVRDRHTDRALNSSPPAKSATIFDLGSPESSDDDDGLIATKPATKRRRLPKPHGENGFIVEDGEAEILKSSDNEEDEEPVTPVKRKRPAATPKSPRTRRLKSRRERQELLEDLDDLQDSDSDRLQSSRTRGAIVNKERERQRFLLENLKRRRAGKKIPISISSENGESEGVNETGEPGAESYDSEIGERDTALTRLNTHSDGFLGQTLLEGGEDEDDFVVSDDEPPDHLGRPHPDVPLEFTSYASSKPRELFVFVIEWLIKNKIAPAFSRHDQLWKLAFSKIKDELTAQAGSRLKSSAWTNTFTLALNARPELSTRKLGPGEALFEHSCDACNRTGHPAQYEFIFSGSPYHHETLDVVEADSCSETDDRSGPAASLDSQGHPLAPSTTHYNLGRYCAANAELAHKFTHWKYSLNETLMVYLEAEGVLSAESIVRRERLKGGQRKREKEAEEIVDRMKTTGEIERMWRGFKEDLQDARLGMEGFERKGGRGKNRIGSVRVAVAVPSDGFAVDTAAHGEGADGEREENLVLEAMFAAADSEGE